MRLKVTYKDGGELYLDVIKFYGERKTGWWYMTRQLPTMRLVRRKFSRKYVTNVEEVWEPDEQFNKYLLEVMYGTN